MHNQCKIRKANFYCLITNVCYCKCIMKVTVFGVHMYQFRLLLKKKNQNSLKFSLLSLFLIVESKTICL